VQDIERISRTVAGHESGRENGSLQKLSTTPVVDTRPGKCWGSVGRNLSKICYIPDRLRTADSAGIPSTWHPPKVYYFGVPPF